MSASSMLAIHGTKPSTLSPQAIIQTAQADMRRKARNAKLKSERERFKKEKKAMDMLDKAEPYGFWRKHVLEAKDAVDLLRIAVERRQEVITKLEFWECECRTLPPDVERPKCPFSGETIRLYDNADALWAAAHAA